jgi:hypothetical protein
MVFRELERSGDLERALDAVAGEFPSIPVSEIRTDVDRLVSGLLIRGLLVLPPHVRHAGGTPIALTIRHDKVAISHRLLAALCLLAAVALLRFPFSTVIRVVTTVRQALARRVASQADGRASVAAVERMSKYAPVRIACMEISLASVLLCALRGRALDWCFGHSADPIAFHSWVEANGEPVLDPADEPIATLYRKVLVV